MAANDAPRTVTTPAGRQDIATTYAYKYSTSRDRARLIVAPDGRYWIMSDDLEIERELQTLASRLAEVLVEHVGGAA